MKSVKKNVVINMIRILINLIFPIITFPYLSRHLQPIGIGRIEFSNSIINYFILFCSLGIPLYGTREIAANRDNKNKMSKIFIELFSINILMAVLGYIILFFYIKLTTNQNIDKILLYILSINLLFTVIGVEWFYQGIEEYSYITIRSTIIKIISVLLILLLIKTPEDYLKYGIIHVLSTSGSNVLNLIRLRKYLVFIKMKIDIRKHIKSILKIFLMAIAGSIYLNLDSVMLGYIKGPKDVGIYSAALKMNKIIVGVITGIGACLIPRISNCIENKNEEEYLKIGNFAIRFMFFIIFPSIIGFYLCAEEIIIIFSGESYLLGLSTLKIMLPIIFLIPLNNFIGIQILYPNKKENLVLYSILGGGLLNFSINYFLIPYYSYIGAAIATLCAEGIIFILLLTFGKKYLIFDFKNKNILKYGISAIFMGLILMIFKNLNFIYKLPLGVLIYFGSLLFLKEEFIYEFIKKYSKFKF